MNEQILAKLIEIANYVFDNLLSIKDGVYTSAELCSQKDALGKDIVMSFSDVETHTVEVGTFKCSFRSDRIFFAVWKFEQLTKVKQKDKVRFTKGVAKEIPIKEVAMYVDKKNKIQTKPKKLVKVSDNVAFERNGKYCVNIFYLYGGLWYQVFTFTLESQANQIKRAIEENPDLMIDRIKEYDFSKPYILNEILESLRDAMGVDVCKSESDCDKCDLSHENNVADTTTPNDKENQSELIPDSKNEVFNKDVKYYLSFEIDKHNFEIDFSGKLDTPYRINETFDDLLNCLYDAEYYELARSELYERILRYSHEHFGSIGYVNHCRLGNVAAELFMQRIISDINIRGETFR